MAVIKSIAICFIGAIVLFAGLNTAAAVQGIESKSAQHTLKQSAPADRLVKLDENGVLRWADIGSEVALFGVNYTTPFAYSYRAIGYVGASRQQTIDQDVSHFARMGLDAFRVHMWDRELTDREGNLLENEHLRLLDYLIWQCKLRGIYTLLTPLHWFGSQYPEPARDEASGGFSNYFGHKQLMTDPNALRAQHRYITQLMNHINPYTKLAYKDDPAIICFELASEPWAPSLEAMAEYIDSLVEVFRDAGCNKPLLYNLTIWPESIDVVCNSKADGVTFGWYPLGLVSGGTLQGNHLPVVDEYPFMHEPKLAGKLKIVYEFDPADFAGSYMHPALARTFRTGGAQWATNFSYDPLPIAYCNTEYQTHYLNLLYTPNKAISVMIAAEAFRTLPRLKSYGKYPENTRFGPFRVSYQQDLSEMVTNEQFMYSNNTETLPAKPKMLERIAGCGSSPVVEYEGTGSYFLEKLADGIWRLEVYPDAVWINDPFEKPGIEWEVSRLIWRNWPMKVNLPDLEQDFTVEPVNEKNTYRTKAKNGSFTIRPGVYLLKNKTAKSANYKPSMPFGSLSLGEFVTPAEKLKPTIVLHKPPLEIVESRPWRIKAKVVSSVDSAKVTLYLRRARELKFKDYPMQRQRSYDYAVTIPADKIKEGLLEYYIILQQGDKIWQFPDNVQISAVPSDWYGHIERMWETLVVGKDAPVVLFNARRDRDRLYITNVWQAVKYDMDFVLGMNKGQLALRIDVPDFKPQPQDVSARFVFAGKIDTRREDFGGFKSLKVCARAATEATSHFEMALIEKDGSAWGAAIPLTTKWQEIKVPLTSLGQRAITDLPQAAPKSPVYWKKGPANRGGKTDRLKLKNIEAIQFSIGARLFPDQLDKPHGIEIESVTLEDSDCL